MKKLVSLLLVLALTLGIASACAESAFSFDGQRVRIVIGSTSTSGDSYLIAETFNQYFQKYAGANSKVDAVGANAALETIATAAPDGLTFMAFHDMTYLGVLFGANEERYALENMVVGPRIGQNPGSCFLASADAPYNDLKELADWLVANPEENVRIAVEEGGVSHVGFVAYWAWVKEAYGEEVADRVNIIPGGSTNDKQQMLWDGNADVIFADYSSCLQYTQEGVDAQVAMKFVGMLDNIPGIEGLPVMGDIGITLGGEPFYFSKDFLIYLPAGVPDAVVAELDRLITEITADADFQADMAKLTYAGNTLTSAEAKDFIYAKRDGIAGVLADAPSFDDLMN